MTSKLILTLDEALIEAEQVEPKPKRDTHPNWFREKANLTTSVLASLPADFGQPDSVSDHKIKLSIKQLAYSILKFNKKIKNSDSFILENSDLPSFLKMNPYIQTILLPHSENQSTNYWAFIKYLDENRIRHTLPKSLQDGQSFLLDCNRRVKCVIANSTSKSTLGIESAAVLKKFKKVTAA